MQVIAIRSQEQKPSWSKLVININTCNTECVTIFLSYFFGYKMEFFFSFQNNPKNLDPSYKTDLDLWDCLGRVELVL